MMDWYLLEKKLDINILEKPSLSGGDISAVYKIKTPDNEYVIKINDVSAQSMFKAEKQGLDLLRQANALTVPKVIEVGTVGNHIFLLMEYIKPSQPEPFTFVRFGSALAQLHKNSQAFYGLDHDNWIGSLPQTNKSCEEWHTFYYHQRLKPQINLALEKNLLSRGELPTQDVILDVAKTLFCPSPPALLHGDLWNGNYMVTDKGRIALIDPAVYYGHPMMDIGMTKLFGGFSDDFYTSYFDNSNITGDIQAQIALAQLYYLLVHLNLFGTGYKGQVLEIFNSYF